MLLSIEPFNKRRTQSAWIKALALSITSLLLLSGCSKEASTGKLSSRIMLTADIRGRLVPCGCFTGQLGGMTRLHTMLLHDQHVNELRLDAGDALQGVEDFEIMEYERILQAFELMDYDALNLGAREAQLSFDTIQHLSTQSNAPLISANIIDSSTGNPAVAPYLESMLPNGTSVIITGVLDPTTMKGKTAGKGLTLADPQLTLRTLLPDLRSRCDLLILLAFADETQLHALAEEFFEADFILGGAVSQPSGNTRPINQSHVFYVANESRTLGQVDFSYIKKKNSQRLELMIDEARPILLLDTIPESPGIVEMANEYRDAVRAAKLDIDSPETLHTGHIPGVRITSKYVGSDACMSCHSEDYAHWKTTGHSHAWQTLVYKNADADPNCIACHSVGFGSISGYRREFKHEKLVNVGCESCHGPGSQHIAERSNPKQKITFHFRPLAEGDCRKCHHGEFSRPFEWDVFWPEVAHGQSQSTKISYAQPRTSKPQ